jgi:hypothetical protein
MAEEEKNQRKNAIGLNLAGDEDHVAVNFSVFVFPFQKQKFSKILGFIFPFFFSCLLLTN